MTELATVAVPVDDLHALVAGFAAVDQSFGSFLGVTPGYAAAQDACGRLAQTLHNAPAGLPPDPVSGPEQGALGTHEMMLTYERAGFTRGEAFELTAIWARAGAEAVMRRGLPGG